MENEQCGSEIRGGAPQGLAMRPNVRVKPRVPTPAETAQGPGTGGVRPTRLRQSCLAKSTTYAIGSWRAGDNGMARWAACAKWAEGPALDGQRGMPLALRLSEGLGLRRCRLTEVVANNCTY